MVTTVVKTIGSTGVFSTPQLWEDGAPANLTTAEKSAATTFATASFVQGENLTFVGSGATGKFLDTDSTGPGSGSYVVYGITIGNPVASDVVTGATSGATCVLSSSTPMDTGIIWEGQCQNQEFVGSGTQLTVSGATVNSTAYKHITTVAGASFRDHASVQSNALRYDATKGAAIRNSGTSDPAVLMGEASSRISGLQVANLVSNGTGMTFQAAGARADNCIIEGKDAGATDADGVIILTSAVMHNCVVIGRASGMDHLVGITVSATLVCYNCTFVCPTGFADQIDFVFRSNASNTNTHTIYNCALFAGDASKAIKTGGGTYNFTSCCSDISGTSGVAQSTYTDAFQNVADSTHDYRLKTGSGLVNTGSDHSEPALQEDIAGTARPHGPRWDVGAWEFAYDLGTPTNPLRVSQSNLHW